MPVDIRGIEIALVKAVRAAVGSDLAVIGTGINIWDTIGTGFVSNPNHIFAANSLSVAETARNDYFTANPSELIVGIKVTLDVTGYAAIRQTYQQGKAAVIRSRLYSTGSSTETPPFPDYPYASVDYTRITDEGYELTERYFDENDNYIYRTHKLASYSIKFFGTSKDDILGICNKMHMMLEVDGIRGMIHTLSPTEARIRSKSDPVFVASAMEDKYREVASFDLILSVLDEVIIPPDQDGSEYIENVILDTTVPQQGIQGGIFKDPDTNPDLHVDVETTVTYP